jgi:glycosyltransferase involved in cell wall biosynthesis
MQILILSPFFPLPLVSGGHTRLFNLIKELSSRHVLDLVTPVSGSEADLVQEMKKFCRNVVTVSIDNLYLRGGKNRVGLLHIRRILLRLWLLFRGVPLEASAFYYPDLKARLNELLVLHRYDVIQVEFTRMALYFSKDFYRDYTAQKVLIDYDLAFITHKRKFESADTILSKAVRYLDYRINESFALRVWKQFDVFVVVSDVDREKALQYLPGLSVSVVPNGVDLSYFVPPEKEQTERRLLFLGGSGHYPNVDGLAYFMSEVYPRVTAAAGDISLTVVGGGWDSRNGRFSASSGIHFTGYVDDVREYMKGTVVFIAPLRIGGGTRLKILEAMAMRVPVIATSVACEGLSVENERHLLIADTPQEFAAGIIRLFDDGKLSDMIIYNAYKLVTERFSWGNLCHELEKVYGNYRRSG